MRTRVTVDAFVVARGLDENHTPAVCSQVFGNLTKVAIPAPALLLLFVAVSSGLRL